MLAQAEIGAVDMGDLRRLILAIAKITIAVESVLALILFVRFWQAGYEDGPIASAYSGIFHSIASFNNAGFSLYSDNLARFVGDPIVVIGVSAGFIIGGFGFPILVEFWRRGSARRAEVRRRPTGPCTPRSPCWRPADCWSSGRSW
jgi:trk system potassium uptake protein